MLSVVVFGVICELNEDEDPYATTFYYDPAPAPKKTESPHEIAAPEPNTAQTRPRRSRRQRAYVHTTRDQTPQWQRRWETFRERRRKHVGLNFTEFADLSDSRRVIIRNDRGFGWSWRHSPGPWHGTTRESLADDVRNYYVFEEEECCPTSPEWIVEHLQRFYDIKIDAASAQAALQLPRHVELDTRLLQQLPR